MRTLITVIALFLFLPAVNAQENKQTGSVSYIFFFADVDKDGVSSRYFSPILDQATGVDKDCLTKLAEQEIKLKAGDGAVIGKVQMEVSRDYDDAEDLILNKLTLPDKKTTYFVLKPDC